HHFANALLGLQEVLDNNPSIEYIVTQGDTNTSIACAKIAFLNKKKLLHIEAGLRSFDFNSPFPEEFNRFFTSKLAYFHFAPTLLSKKNLVKEGVSPDRIMVTGNTSIDSLRTARHELSRKLISQDKNKVLVTIHRRENKENLGQMFKVIS